MNVPTQRALKFSTVRGTTSPNKAMTTRPREFELDRKANRTATPLLTSRTSIDCDIEVDLVRDLCLVDGNATTHAGRFEMGTTFVGNVDCCVTQNPQHQLNVQATTKTQWVHAGAASQTATV
jgi:hypothetical protein